MSIRKKELIKWMDELVTDKDRDERRLFSVWQLLKEVLEKEQ